MNARSIIFSIATGLVLMGLFVLFFKVRGNPTVEVPEQALEEARQRHERAKAARSRPAPGPAQMSARSAARRPAPPQRAPEPAQARDAEPEPASPRPPVADRRPPRTQFATMKGNPLQRSLEYRQRMDEVNKLYDDRDYEGAIAAAQEVLKDTPRNVRMLRVVVSSACIMGDEGMVREHYSMLPARDQRQMSVRCRRYGVELEPPAAEDR